MSFERFLNLGRVYQEIHAHTLPQANNSSWVWQ